MTARTSFNRLILRAVLRNVSPMVIRVISVPDSLDLADFDDLPHCSRLGQFRVHLPGSWPGVQGVTPQFPILTRISSSLTSGVPPEFPQCFANVSKTWCDDCRRQRSVGQPFC